MVERGENFVKLCSENIVLYKQMATIENSYGEDSPPNAPAFKRLAMFYEKHGRYEGSRCCMYGCIVIWRTCWKHAWDVCSEWSKSLVAHPQIRKWRLLINLTNHRAFLIAKVGKAPDTLTRVPEMMDIPPILQSDTSKMEKGIIMERNYKKQSPL